MRTKEIVKAEREINNEMLNDITVVNLDYIKNNTRVDAFKKVAKDGFILKLSELFLDTRKDPTEMICNDPYLSELFIMLRSENKSLFMFEIKVLELD